MKYSFYNDYSEGAHDAVLKMLCTENLRQVSGYGADIFSQEAADMLRAEMHAPYAAVHFVSAGTQANFIVLASMLKSHEAIIAVDAGHIHVHEAGAIEATGHKIIAVPHIQGKLTPQAIENVCTTHTNEHHVMPRVVYISNTTELGTIYTKDELQALSAVCKKHHLFFYLDGARLASALTARASQITLADIAELVDAFYIGGTKNGALFGEAVVLLNADLQKDFRYHLKQRGALLAKGRAISLQFKALFTDGLYFALAQHAHAMAAMLVAGIEHTGYVFSTPPESNQIFPILPNAVISALEKDYGFYVWSPGETESVVRLVTSWTTDPEHVQGFVERLQELSKSR